jgi:Arm DNA-binding domain
LPRVAKELGPLDVKRATPAGGKGNTMLPVGGVAGLYLQITRKGGEKWILRAAMGGRRAEIGLGGFPTVTLAQARDKIKRGQDPMAERKAARAALAAALRPGLTFAEAANRYLDAKLDA